MIAKRLLTPADIVKKFGDIPTYCIPHAQALIGDKTDNIPGCPGIGKTGAAKLINHYGSIECIYDNLETATSMSPGMRATLVENRDDVFLSLELATLKLDVPLEVPISSFAWTGIDHDRLQVYLREQGFRSLEEEMAA